MPPVPGFYLASFYLLLLFYSQVFLLFFKLYFSSLLLLPMSRWETKQSMQGVDTAKREAKTYHWFCQLYEIKWLPRRFFFHSSLLFFKKISSYLWQQYRLLQQSDLSWQCPFKLDFSNRITNFIKQPKSMLCIRHGPKPIKALLFKHAPPFSFYLPSRVFIVKQAFFFFF